MNIEAFWNKTTIYDIVRFCVMNGYEPEINDGKIRLRRIKDED